MSDDPAPAIGLLAAATAVVSALWLALRGERAAATARLEASVKEATERAARYETTAFYWQRKYTELAAEVKSAAARRHSLPPGRDELPTLDAILDLRDGDPVAARQAAIDAELRPYLHSAPPPVGGALRLPLAGVAPTPPRRKPPR